MEWVDVVIKIINECGFPIFAFVAMFVLYYKFINKFDMSIRTLTDAVNDLREMLKKDA